MRVPALALKAELVFAVQLVVRHRTPRLAAVFALLTVALLTWYDATDPNAASHHGALLLIAGSLAAVSGSRLLAPGGSLEAARRVAANWWVVPTGRLAGVLLTSAPLIAVAIVALRGVDAGQLAFARLAAAAVLLAASIAAVTLSITPLVGSSASAALGFSASWFGGIPPSVLHAGLVDWPIVQRPAVILWNVLPLPWRAARWMEAGGVEDPIVMLAWSLFGIVAAWWAILRTATERGGAP